MWHLFLNNEKWGEHFYPLKICFAKNWILFDFLLTLYFTTCLLHTDFSDIYHKMCINRTFFIKLRLRRAAVYYIMGSQNCLPQNQPYELLNNPKYPKIPNFRVSLNPSKKGQNTHSQNTPRDPILGAPRRS